MLVSSFIGSASATAGAASAVVTPNYALAGGGAKRRSLMALIARTGGVADSPVTAVSYGSDAFAFLAAQASTINSGTVEVWQVDDPVTISSPVTAAFASGTTVSVGLVLVELNSTQPAGAVSPVGSASLSGTVTVSYTSGATLWGRGGSVGVPVTNNLLVGVGCLTKPVSGNAIDNSGSTNVLVNSMVIASGVNKMIMAAAYVQADGTNQTMSWNQSGTSTEWCDLLVDLPGITLEGGALRAPMVLPNEF